MLQRGGRGQLELGPTHPRVVPPGWAWDVDPPVTARELWGWEQCYPFPAPHPVLLPGAPAGLPERPWDRGADTGCGGGRHRSGTCSLDHLCVGVTPGTRTHTGYTHARGNYTNTNFYTNIRTAARPPPALLSVFPVQTLDPALPFLVLCPLLGSCTQARLRHFVF